MTSATRPYDVHPFSLPHGASARLDILLDALAFLSLCLFVAAIPFEGEDLFGGPPADRWFGAMAVGFLLLRVAATGRLRRIAPMHYWVLALTGWAALSLIWTVDTSATLLRVETYGQMLMLVWLAWELGTTQARIAALLQSYVAGTLLSALYTVWNFAQGVTASKLYAEQGRQVWEEARYSIAGMNENDLGLFLALSIPMALYLMVQGKYRPLKLAYWIHIAVCLTAVLLTGSRGALVSSCAGLLMLPMIFRRMARPQRMMTVAAGIGVGLAAALLVPAETWERLFQLGSEISSGTMTHRTVIWAAGLDTFREHALLGVGAGGYAPAVYRILDIPLIAHNTFLSVLVELGVLGFLLFIAMLAGLVYTASRMEFLEKRLWFTVLLTWTVGVSALAWEYRKPTWIIFGLLIAHVHVRPLLVRTFQPAVQPQAYGAYVHRDSIQPKLAPAPQWRPARLPR